MHHLYEEHRNEVTQIMDEISMSSLVNYEGAMKRIVIFLGHQTVTEKKNISYCI